MKTPSADQINSPTGRSRRQFAAVTVGCVAAAANGLALPASAANAPAPASVTSATSAGRRPAQPTVPIQSVDQCADTTSSRVALTDWYDTTTAWQNRFQDRPVAGRHLALLTA